MATGEGGTARDEASSDRAVKKKPSFLVVYGQGAKIECVTCRNETRIVPNLKGEVTPEVVAHYRRTHECGPRMDGWDLSAVEDVS